MYLQKVISRKTLNPDPLVGGMDPRIRIHTKMSWIRDTARRICKRKCQEISCVCLLAVVLQVAEQEDDPHILQHLHISRPRPSDGEYNERFQEKLLLSNAP
jgi:hypothetical protein